VLVVDVAKKEFRYYDSLGGANFRCTEIIRDYLKENTLIQMSPHGNY
jgi:Ulp1 family protease